MPATTYLSNKLLDHAVGKASYTSPTVYVALHAGSPTISGTGGTEANYTGYARQATTGSTWGSAASQADANATAINFPAPTAAAGQNITHATLWDALTGGNMTEFYSITGGGFTTAVGAPPGIGVGQFTRSLT